MLSLRARVDLKAMEIKHYWCLTIRLLNAITRTLVGGVLPLCRDAVRVFYSPSRLDLKMVEFIYIYIYSYVVCYIDKGSLHNIWKRRQFLKIHQRHASENKRVWSDDCISKTPWVTMCRWLCDYVILTLYNILQTEGQYILDHFSYCIPTPFEKHLKKFNNLRHFFLMLLLFPPITFSSTDGLTSKLDEKHTKINNIKCSNLSCHFCSSYICFPTRRCEFYWEE